jgi:hypothetical protein
MNIEEEKAGEGILILIQHFILPFTDEEEEKHLEGCLMHHSG